MNAKEKILTEILDKHLEIIQNAKREGKINLSDYTIPFLNKLSVFKEDISESVYQKYNDLYMKSRGK